MGGTGLPRVGLSSLPSEGPGGGNSASCIGKQPSPRQHLRISTPQALRSSGSLGGHSILALVSTTRPNRCRKGVLGTRVLRNRFSAPGALLGSTRTRSPSGELSVLATSRSGQSPRSFKPGTTCKVTERATKNTGRRASAACVRERGRATYNGAHVSARVCVRRSALTRGSRAPESA